MADRESTLRRRLGDLRRKAGEVDSRPGVLAAMGTLREWLPGDDRYGDTMSVGGRRPHQLLGQGLAAWAPRRQSAARELGLAALQLWQAASEAQGRGRGEREVSLAFTDVVGFSEWALRSGDHAAVALVRELDELTRRAVAEAGGRVVKHLGDGWMLAFEESDAAAQAVLSLCEQAAGLRGPDEPLRLRAGLHRGRPRPLGEDLLGVDVNITARVAAAAPAAGALATGALAGELDRGRFRVGPAEPLRASGAPEGLCVHRLQALA